MRRLGLPLSAFVLVLALAGIVYPVVSASSAQASEEKKDEEKKPGPPEPVYVDLAPMALPVIDGDKIAQVLQFTITLEVPDAEAANKITEAKPRLTDAYIQDLYGALERRQVMDGRILNVGRLRDELARISANVLGENGFKSILIQKVSQRMM